jgi:hypothetical protein
VTVMHRIGTWLLIALLGLPARDGQHDFDFNIGAWHTHVKRLQHPLTGSSTWLTYDGTVVVRKVWGGKANLEELAIDGPTGHLEGLTLRLYDPRSHQWNLNWASTSDGTFDTPLVGAFTDGKGEFIDRESVDGRSILVRHQYTNITPASHHFEQSFSDDGGKTWESNWVATLTPTAPPGPRVVAPSTDGQHDFDFNIGTWRTHIRRLIHPLTNSTTWTEYTGTHTVNKVWDGRANLGELEVDGPTGHLEVLSLRLYNPQSNQWSLNFATSGTGTLGVPSIGQFKDGRGEFYDQEVYNGRAILVRSVWSDITPTTCHLEQAFSEDGGKSWEVNWVAADTLVRGASDAR